jgi:fibro-slime domain-containing protein
MTRVHVALGIGVCALAAFASACSAKSPESNFGSGLDASSANAVEAGSPFPDGAAESAVSPGGGDAGMLQLPDAGAVPDADGIADGDLDGGSSSVLTMHIRDFKMWDASDPTTNPDFENEMGDDRGIVQMTLGTDGKPVYQTATPTTATTHGAADFNEWYNDTPGMNIDVSYPIPLTASADGGLYGYDSLVSGVPLSATDPTNEFFPIDDGTPYATAFGNQGKPHNYSFTTELHTVFTYNGGETFSFSGDDDVFVFINDALVIDLGGVHVREVGSISLDTLGLVKGNDYPLDLFGAERHTTESNVSFQTTLVLRPAMMPPPK